MSSGCSPEYLSDLREIESAIEAEKRRAGDYYSFTVEQIWRNGDCWSVNVGIDSNHKSGLDETLEGSIAWWPKPEKGAAEVLSVIPEEGQINLRFASGNPPGRDGHIRIYPPAYLQPFGLPPKN